MLIGMVLFGACRSEDVYKEGVVVDTAETLSDADGDGYFSDEDCDDSSSTVYPGSEELCDGMDNDCDGDIDEGVTSTFYLDADQDGFGNNAETIESCDVRDGYVAIGNDCDDGNADVFPSAPEVCDEVDNDCNELVDDNVGSIYYLDQDMDGFGLDSETFLLCSDTEGFASTAGDCNDFNDQVYPGAPELCDELDNDCNEVVDDGGLYTFYADADEDGYGDAGDFVESCSIPEGYVFNSDDCDDAASNINPSAEEVCNGIDDNCDTVIDDGVEILYYADTDADGFGNASNTTYNCSEPTGYTTNDLDCDDGNGAVNPNAAEVCNGLDENCNGVIDEGVETAYYYDGDADGWGDSSTMILSCNAPAQHVLQNGDCDDVDPDIYPSNQEVCDSIDNNCNAMVDEGVESTFYFDDDGDGYGDSNTSIMGCTVPTDYTSALGDCDDTNVDIYPGASLGCDGVDYDCDGIIDNDADGDGYSDVTCGGLDCDDDDVTVYDVCIDGTSCIDILTQGGSTGDGMYEIDPDGVGGEDSYFVYCDMTTNGGGWTLAMRFDNPSQFTFNSPYWTNETTLNETDTDPNGTTDAKYQAFSTLQATAIQGCMTRAGSGGCKMYALTQPQTLYSLFTNTPIGSDSNNSGGLFFSEASSDSMDWLTIIGIGSSNLTSPTLNNYVRVGINIDDDLSCCDARVRFGLALNNQTDIYTLNDTAGFGASSYYDCSSCSDPLTSDHPWSVGAGFTSDKGNFDAYGTIWVR